MKVKAGTQVKKVKNNLLQIRMSDDSIAILKEVAEWKGISYSTLARMWILQHLAQERKENPGRSRFGEIYRSTITLPDENPE